MNFHLIAFAFTLCDLQRSNHDGPHIFNGRCLGNGDDELIFTIKHEWELIHEISYGNIYFDFR